MTEADCYIGDRDDQEDVVLALALDGVRGVLEGAHRELQELGAADRRAVAEGKYVSTAWRYIETTADAAIFERGRAQLCHVGNGRIYRLRDGRLERVMDAQNRPEHWKVMSPELTEEQLASLPSRVLLRALGFVGALLVEEATLPTAPGDVFLIASDGLCDLLPDDAIADVLRRGGTARALIEAAITVEPPTYGRDNMAAAVHVVGADGL